MTQLVSEAMKQHLSLISLLKQHDIYTYFLPVSSACENHIRVNGKDCINFISNNYLGFSTHPKVKEAVAGALEKYGLGIGGSPIACGSTDLHYELNERIARTYGMEDSVLFASGYQALLGSIQATVKKGDVVLLDGLVHRSIVDGVALSEADKRMWLHNDMEDLEQLLERVKKKYDRMLIVVDSVYSMDGDIAHLPEIRRLADSHGALVLVDEAHSLGVIGGRGYGILDHFNMPGGADVVSGTFSKFAGAVGGFAAASKDFIAFLRHNCSPFIFSASLSPLIVAGVLKSFDLLDQEPQWRENLIKNSRSFIDGLKSLGFDTGTSVTACVPIILRDTQKTMAFNKIILENGIFATPVVHPAVPHTESRIRLGVMATHTAADIDRSMEVFKKAGKELGII